MKKMFFTGLFTVMFCAAVCAATVDGIAGFATQNGGTTGGAGGEVVTVTNLADFMTAVRDADPTPRTVYINAAELNSGDDKGKQVKLGNNKTIIGCGSGTFMNGILLGINGKTNIIIRNLRFSMTSITNTTDPAVYDPDGDEGRPQIIVNGGDCISIQGASSQIWIDHCEFSQADPAVQTNQDLYDGLIDAKNTSEYITISWCYFHDHHKTHLVGSSDSDNYDRKMTFHHNYYKNISERLPSYRFGTGHVFNNYYLDAHSSGVNSRMGACLRVESNYFEASADPIISKNSTAVGYWDLHNSTNGADNSNIYSGCSGSQPTTSNCAFTPPYAYSTFLDPAANVKSIVMANVGVGKINPGCGTVNTPTRTPSLPAATNTRTRTSTPSATRTSTVVPTFTSSVLPSYTGTHTRTRTVTPTFTRTASATVTVALTFTNTRTPTNTPVTAGTPVFANGADTGWLSQMEDSGKKFYNDAGAEQDCLQILKDHCVNSIRLRVWVNPAGGWCGKTDVINMAVRAKNMGFRIMIDFHYSDSWADPGQQTKPAAWAAYNFTQLRQAVYDHTADVLSGLNAAGVTPEWVQVGNETNNGMLWEDGRASVNMANFAQLTASGYDAVKSVFPQAKVIVHVSNGWDNALFRWIFDGLQNNGGKWDVIGMSLYPDPGTWAATTAQCLTNMNDMISRYPGKEVMISEVGMSYDQPLASHDFIADIITKVKSLPDGKGLGVFYWEPECYSWQGYTKGAFDNTGKPTTAMDAFLENCPVAVPTPTRTAVSTPSRTATRTATVMPPTATFTRSASASMTPTIIITNTQTLTNTPVPSASVTRTVTPSFTRTSTQTGTLTPYPLIPTFTATATRTVTAVPPTVTFTVTVSGTATPTRTGTVVLTFTRTSTLTATLTPYPLTATFTATATRTITVVPSATVTATLENPTATSSASPASTFTFTPANSATRTATLISSPSMTATSTNTMVSSPSNSATPTRTPSVTPSLTLTLTASTTQTVTATRSTLTATPSLTTIPLSPTPTFTPTPDSGPWTLDIVLYPNPLTGTRGLNAGINSSRPITKIMYKIYTASFRLAAHDIQAVNLSAGAGSFYIEPYKIRRLANGTYYCIFEAEDFNRYKIKSTPCTLIVMK